jgi:hypothetical protein
MQGENDEGRISCRGGSKRGACRGVKWPGRGIPLEGPEKSFYESFRGHVGIFLCIPERAICTFPGNAASRGRYAWRCSGEAAALSPGIRRAPTVDDLPFLACLAAADEAEAGDVACDERGEVLRVGALAERDDDNDFAELGATVPLCGA